MLAALERGVIDGFCLSSPTSDVAVSRGQAAFLFNMSRNPPPEFADYLYIAATATDRVAAERGPQLVAYCRGLAAALRAIREDAQVAAFAGKDVFAFKVQAFAIGGGIAGLAGALYAHYTS